MDYDEQELKEIKEVVKRVGKFAGIGLLIVLLLVTIFGVFKLIPAGHRGVVTTMGKVEKRIMGEGLNFKIPLVQSVQKMDVQITKKQVDCTSASKDLQDVHMTIAINYFAMPGDVNWIYQNIGLSYPEKIIDPMLQEIVKAISAKYTVVELITNREAVRNEIKELMRKKLLEYKISVCDLSIVNFKFSEKFSAAIEAKQTAEQLALKAARDLDRVKVEAQQKIASAQAEAESLRLQKQNVSAELIQLRQVERDIKAIERWDGHLPNVTSGAIPFINVNAK